jgi:pyrimidine operon attenuation protein / uracil phosphoribosyltransferase
MIREIMSADEIVRSIDRFAADIVKNNPDLAKLAFVGIQTRGVFLAERIRKKIEDLKSVKMKHGILDITFYRDDLDSRGILPRIKETRIDFDVNEMNIILVDDVIFTGRTIKAALESLDSFGRSAKVELCTLIDRGCRELPVQPDYFGIKIQTKKSDSINVKLVEKDGVDHVELVES